MCNNGKEIDIVPALCECAEDGIWTIFQKRYDGSVGFYRNWADYKEGFGDLKGEYWLGNDAIHQITSSANYTLKIYLTDWDNVTKYAMYDLFRIADEADGYRLTIGGYSGDAGDSMILNHNGKMFSTKDRDNDEQPNANNAERFHGAWWYDDNSLNSNLNGQYYFYPNDTLINNGIAWWGWFIDYGSGGFALKETKMMIHRNK